MIYFFRLIRPINLLIIALTMYSAMCFLTVYEKLTQQKLTFSSTENLDFFLLVLSTVLIAAAGNIINDYFDVRADRVNKPEKLIITKYLKRRWAIVSHWFLNVFAFSIAIYLSIKNQTFWYVFIHLLTINTLWFYSANLKRKPLIGNIIIASLTALVPILCGVHIYYHSQINVPDTFDTSNTFDHWIYDFIENGNFIFILSFFAFTNNLAREIIKDIEDQEGDKLLNAKTFPILYGNRKSKWLACIPLFLAPSFFIGFISYHVSHINLQETLILFIPVIVALLLNLFSIFLLIKAEKRNELKLSDFFIKLSMLAGISLPFYWLMLIP